MRKQKYELSSYEKKMEKDIKIRQIAAAALRGQLRC